MTVQTVTFGSGQYNSFTSAASGTDYVSNWTMSGSVTTSEAPLTGSFTLTTRPIRLGTLTLFWWASANPTTTVIQFQIATNSSGGGGVQSGDTNANGTTTAVGMNYVTDRTATVYYGFQKRDTGNVRFSTYSSTGNNVYVNGSATTYPDRREYATITVNSIPDAPGIPNLVSSTATTLTVSWGAVTDTGDGLVNGYRLAIKESSLPDGTANANWRIATVSGQASLGDTGSTTRQATITGLYPGTSYDIIVAALNGVTDALNTDYSLIASHTGTRSATASLSTQSGVYNGTSWVAPTSYVHNGTTWISANVQVYDGNSWDQWGYRPS